MRCGRLAFFLLALFPALLGFDHVLAQLAVHAEQATVVDYKLRLLLFFVCHRSFAQNWNGMDCTVAFCSPICTAVPGASNSRRR